MAKKLKKFEEGGTKNKLRLPGKLETNQSDNTRVLNTEGRTVANSKLQDGYNKNEIIQYGTNKGKPYGFENQTIRGGMESLITPDNVMMATGVGALAKAGVNTLGKRFLPKQPAKIIKELPNSTQNFNSEIDWSKWNKEIPGNPSLMKEYNAIEQTSKTNNSWMKNPDGSAFQGTPEQFVQQNSSNFKKAYPEGYNKVYRGGDNENLANRPHPIVFTGDKVTAQHYTGGSEFANNIATPEQHGGRALFDLYSPKSNNGIIINNQGRSWREIPRKYFGDNPPPRDLHNTKGDFTSTDDIAKWMVKNDKNSVRLNNIFDSYDADFVDIINHKPGNYLKSAIGNNGMFDMTNPNIYKAVAPITVGVGAAAASQQKRNGGTIDEEAGNRGMMKARMALDAHFGNPSAQRMVSPNPKTGMTPKGIGTHYMASMDNYAVPLLQDKGGNYLQYNSNPAPSSEDMRFESPEDAKYFAENYKNIAPMMRSNKFANGGRVLPKFTPGGTWKGTDRSGKAIQTNFSNSTAGQNITTGAGIAGAAVPMLTSFIPDEQVTDSEGNVLGSKENMGKSVLNSAASGASMGMALGPWGALAGAGLGAIYGGVTNSMANEDLNRAQQQANMRIESKNLSNKLLTNQNNYSINSYNNDQMIAANGGTVVNQDMGNPNAELELNETFRDPMTGETGMVDGPSHDNGGIEMNLAEGTQIWSDRLKHNGRTFASLTKPIINQIANLEKGTGSNSNSRFKQNTIKLLNSQLDFFFDKQEAGKQQDEMKRTLKKQNGGVVEDMGNYHYGDGGIHIKPENKGKFTAWANSHDMGVQEAARHVMANKEDYSSTTVKRANFAKNAAGWKHADGGYVLPKFYKAGTFNPNGDPVLNLSGVNTNSFNSAFNNRGMYNKDAVSNYRDNQNADLAEVNNTLGAQMDQINIASRGNAPRTMGPITRPQGYQEPVRPMQTVPTMPMGYDNNAMLKRSIKPYYNNADNNYETAVPIEAQAQEAWKGTMPTDMNSLRRGASDYENTFNDMRGAQSAYENRFRGAQGEYEDLVKLRGAQGEYQNQPVAATQPENRSQRYKNNNGQLIQAGALAGSTFSQLANINRQAAPGINPNVRLTGTTPTPRFMDLSGQRGAINRSALGAMEGAQRGFGSSASAQAFKNKARLDQLQGLGQSYLAQENANADIYNKFAGMQGDAAMREAMMNSEIGRGNLENRFNFDQSKMRGQNAALATLGHGVGDIGRNITNYGNEMDRASILANQYEQSVLGDIYKNDPKLLQEAWDRGQISENTYNKYKNQPQAKYGGTIKKRSLKY